MQSDQVGLVWIGIASTEVAAAMETMAVPADERQETETKVRIMERAALKVHCERHEEAARRMSAKIKSGGKR